MAPESALRDLEVSTRGLVALAWGIDESQVTVSLANEAREGKDGLRIEVLIDGAASAMAEKWIADTLAVATLEALKLIDLGRAKEDA